MLRRTLKLTACIIAGITIPYHVGKALSDINTDYVIHSDSSFILYGQGVAVLAIITMSIAALIGIALRIHEYITEGT